MATGSVLVQRWGRPTTATAFAGWQLAAGGLLLLPVALVAEGTPSALTTSNVAGYVYLAIIGGGLAYTLWFRGIDRLGAGNATFLSLLSPLVATTITLVRGEPMTALQLLGAAAVVASVGVAQRSPVPLVAPAPIPLARSREILEIESHVSRRAS
jgi:probable blue pigment (indigoidine) exporter